MTGPSRPLLLMDSIGRIGPAAAGAVVVCGSHGGTSAAQYVLEQPALPYACIFNDAGIGKDAAGIAGLSLLAERSVIAATCAHDSARIGDAADSLAGGRLSHVNAPASAAGLKAGMMVAEAVRLLGGTE